MPPLPPIPSPPDPSYPWEPFASGDAIAAASLLVGVVTFMFAAWVAIRQLRIMREQTALGEEQKTIAAEQGRIAQKQYEIAEKQDRMMHEQLSRRAELRIAIKPCEPESDVLTAWQWFDVCALNVGTQKAEDVSWQLAVPKTLEDRVKGAAVKPEVRLSDVKVGAQPCMHFSDRHGAAILRRRHARVTSIAFKKGLERESIIIWASVECEDSRCPKGDDEWIGHTIELDSLVPNASPQGSS